MDWNDSVVRLEFYDCGLFDDQVKAMLADHLGSIPHLDLSFSLRIQAAGAKL